MNTYTFTDYNQNHVLKLHWPLKLVILFVLKHYIPGIILGLNTFMRVGIEILDILPKPLKDFTHDYSTPALLLLCLPTLFVLAAAIRRSHSTAPKAGKVLRWSWRYGRVILLYAVLLEFSIILGQTLWGLKRFNEIILLILYLDLMIAVFLLKSSRVKDIFAQFPLTDKEAWAQAVQENTLTSYSNYLNGNEFKQYAGEAYFKMEELAWSQALTKQTLQAFQSYLELNIPNKRHSLEARQRLEELLQQQPEEDD